jgi:hypothetical protein
MTDDHIILGVHITERVTKAPEVQKVFTEFGCNIKTRIGLHDVDAAECSPSGIVLLEFFGEPSEAERMTTRLESIDGVFVQSMVFRH